MHLAGPVRPTRSPVVAALVALLVLGSAVGASASNPEPVLDSPRYELDYSAVPGYRSWIKASDANGYRLIVEPAGEDRYVVAQGAEVGIGSDLALDTVLGDVLVFTQTEVDADLRIWDLDAERFIHTPDGINTADPEYGAEISGEHLLLGRDPRHNGLPTQVVLVDLTSGRSRILARSKGAAGPDSLNGDWATYTVCPTSGPTACDVYRYRISTGRVWALPRSEHRSLYASAVTPDGTVFVVRGPGGCGGGVSIVRWTPDGRRTLTELRDRFDVWNMDVLSEADATTLFFQRTTCSTPLGYDIFRLEV